MYVYIKTESQLWTVGHYHPITGKFITESDHDIREEAAARVAYLNGGGNSQTKTFTSVLKT